MPPPIGLGYAIAIALGFLIILLLLLSSYLCKLPQNPQNPNPNPQIPAPLPFTIIVADDESPIGVVGLDTSTINSYPKFQFARSDLNSEARVCSICLCEYKEGEMLRMMPDCMHAFHLFCLDAWLKLNGSCPVCRNSPLPTPISTPLAEVVPLTQFADNRGRR